MCKNALLVPDNKQAATKSSYCPAVTVPDRQELEYIYNRTRGAPLSKIPRLPKKHFVRSTAVATMCVKGIIHYVLLPSEKFVFPPRDTLPIHVSRHRMAPRESQACKGACPPRLIISFRSYPDTLFRHPWTFSTSPSPSP